MDVREKNELGDTAEALNAAQKQIVSLIGSISTASTDLQDALQSFTGNFSSMQESIGNVAVAVNEIAENSTTQAGSTTEASNGIMTIAEGIEKTPARWRSWSAMPIRCRSIPISRSLSFVN